MKDEKILSFIDRLASDDPTPGGGAAAGVTASMGTAAIMMAIRFSNTTKLEEADKDKLSKAVAQLENSKTVFIDLIEKDETGFEPLSNAFKLPKETDEEKAHRRQEIEKGLVTASEAPLELIEEAKKVMDIAENVFPLIKRGIVSDVGVGTQLIRSALNASSLNVYINADMMKNEETKQDYLSTTDELVSTTIGKSDDLFDKIQTKLRK